MYVFLSRLHPSFAYTGMLTLSLAHFGVKAMFTGYTVKSNGV